MILYTILVLFAGLLGIDFRWENNSPVFFMGAGGSYNFETCGLTFTP
jgi:hypothetical protein